MNTRQAYLIYSVYQNNKTSAENARNHAHEMQYLMGAGIRYKQLKGVYNGVSELSLMIAWSSEAETHVQNTCMLYNQESYLHADANGLATLNAPSGRVITKLGKLKRISASEAKDVDHSMDVDTQEHFVYA